MVRSDFEISQFLLLKIANNVLIPTVLNSRYHLWFERCCNENLLKVVKNWAARHFWKAKDVAIKSWKVVYLYKCFGKLASKPCKGIAYWPHSIDFIVYMIYFIILYIDFMLWNKANRNFWEACWIGMKFVGIHVFMRTFYDNLNLVDSIFSSKVIRSSNFCVVWS